MKKGLTEIIFVVDRSGSMNSIKKDVIGGFNRFIKEQRDAAIGECKVSFNQFDTEYENVYSNINVADVVDLTDKTFVPRGMTALLDAVAKTIKSVGDRLSNTDESLRPEKILVAVLTDGEENSSHEFNAEQVKNMITHQTEKYGWDFVYLGANQDAWKVGTAMGIAGGSTLNYSASAVGMSNMFGSLSSGAIRYRTASTRGYTFTDDDKQKQTDAGVNKV